MERKIVFCVAQADFDVVVGLLAGGWSLDRMINAGKPMRIDFAVIYHLIKFSPEELVEMKQQFQEETERIASIRSVPIEEANPLIKEGYEVLQTYQKSVTLVKKETLKGVDERAREAVKKGEKDEQRTD